MKINDKLTESLATTLTTNITNDLTSKMNSQKVLWQGEWYPAGTHTIYLSEPVSAQKSGIVLVWSQYEPATRKVENWGWNFDFIPKIFVQLRPGVNSHCHMGNFNSPYVCEKQVYIYDDRIIGHEENTKRLENHLRAFNNEYILRYVIGV